MKYLPVIVLKCDSGNALPDPPRFLWSWIFLFIVLLLSIQISKLVLDSFGKFNNYSWDVMGVLQGFILTFSRTSEVPLL